MRTLSVAAAVAALSLSAGAASAQVTPQAMSDWLATQGVAPELAAEGEEAFIRVRDGQLTWLLFFYGCEAAGCDSLQFGAGFTNEAVTADRVNQWNRERRFLKAYFEPGAEGSAVVQYDVLITRGAAVDHLAEHVNLWRGTLADFGVHVGYFTAPE